MLFDNGSQRSYITDSVCSRLNLKPSTSEKLHRNTFGETKFTNRKCEVFQVNLKRPNEKKSLIINALKFPVICSPLPFLVDTDYPHLEGLELADQLVDTSDSIDILVGSGFCWQIVTGETIRGEEGPVAVSSELGWLLSGPVSGTTNNDTGTVSNLIISRESDNVFAENPTDKLVNTLKSFWETENESIQEMVEEQFLNKLNFNGSQYEVGLPWNNNNSSLSNNYNLSLNRLKALQQRFFKEPELAKE